MSLLDSEYIILDDLDSWIEVVQTNDGGSSDNSHEVWIQSKTDSEAQVSEWHRQENIQIHETSPHNIY